MQLADLYDIFNVVVKIMEDKTLWKYSDIRKKAWNSLTDGSPINAVLATFIYSLIISVPVTFIVTASTIFLFVSGGAFIIESESHQIDYSWFASTGFIVFILSFLLILLLIVLFGIFVIAPLTVGYNRYLINMVRKSPDNGFGSIFYSFKKGRYLNQVAGMFAKDIRLALNSVVFFVAIYVPWIIFYFVLPFLDSLGNSNNNLLLILFPMLLILIIFLLPILANLWFIRCAYAYRFTEFIIAEYDGLKMNQAVNLSIKLAKGIKLRMVFLNLTFIGWYFLNYMTSGLLMYWITPYITTAFYKVYCIQKSNNPELFEGLTPFEYDKAILQSDGVEESVTI